MGNAKRILREYGPLWALLLLVIVNTITRSDFLTPENLRNMVSQNAHIGIIALGMTFVIITGGIDLAVGSLAALCGAVALTVMNKNPGEGAILLGAAVSIGAGALAGVLNGVIVAYGRVAPFIVTLAGLAGYRSLALVLGDGGEIRSQVQGLDGIGLGGPALPFAKTASGGPVVFYWSALAFLILAVLSSFLLNKTRFGRYVIAVGANEKAAQYSAIDTRKIKVLTYSLLGGLVGIASFFLLAKLNSVGTGSVGLYYELDAIAAVVIGGTSLRGGYGRIWGTVVGVLLLTVISNMMTSYRIDAEWQGLVRGLIILVAVLIQRSDRD